MNRAWLARRKARRIGRGPSSTSRAIEISVPTHFVSKPPANTLGAHLELVRACFVADATAQESPGSAGSDSLSIEMYKQILVAYDGSDAGRGALDECGSLAATLGAKIHLLAVIPSLPGIMVTEGFIVEDGHDLERQRYQDLLEDGLSRLRWRGCVVDGEIAHGEPVDEICECARRLNADLICVGHRQASTWAQRWWRGSVGKTLVDHEPCSVLIAMNH
jgi:nucleotide-binding universal stress UspA family protein